jgi:hypothetical protein
MMQFEIPKMDKELTWEMEALFTQGVEAKVETKLSNPIGTATEISLMGFFTRSKGQPKNKILLVGLVNGPKGEKGYLSTWGSQFPNL